MGGLWSAQPPEDPDNSSTDMTGEPIDEITVDLKQMTITPTVSNDNQNGSNGGLRGGSDVWGAVRGRGSYRPVLREMDTRPEKVTQFVGTDGTPVKLLSNYIEMKTPSNRVINNYYVRFEPEIESSQMRQQMVRDIKDLFNNSYLFDGLSNIKTCDTNREEQIYLVPHPNDPDIKVKITIRWTEEVEWGSLQMLRWYNLQMRQNFQHLGYSRIGRPYFERGLRETIPDLNIELMMGRLTEISQNDSGILMAIDTIIKFLRSESALDLLKRIRNEFGYQWLGEAKKQLCGTIVMTPYNNKVYKIGDLVESTDVTTFTFKREDRIISLFDYYKEFHNITITHINQPLIECLPSCFDIRSDKTDKRFLVPELCRMSGLTDEMRKDFNLMKRVGELSRLKPEDLVKHLNTFIEKLNSNANVSKDLKIFDLSFDDKLVEVKGRVLPSDKIYMGGDDDFSAQSFDQKTGDFSKQIRSKSLFLPSPSLSKWMIIATKTDEPLVQDFVESLMRVMRPMGVNVSYPRINILVDDSIGSYIKNISDLSGSPCQLVVTIVPDVNKERYDAIKKLCYCRLPMQSQVVNRNTISKKPMILSVCTKIGLQIATKMGAEPWALKIPLKDLMVIGYDKYSDSCDLGRAVGAFVCSLNATLTQWYSRANYYQSMEEMSVNFVNNFKNGIKAYFDKRKSIPQRIVIYRCGVEEDGIKHAFYFELPQIQEALKELGENVPRLTFIVVTNRVMTRFFSKEGPSYDNPIPGTIVDSEVTRLRRYDFFLISQAVKKGSVAPTQYNIIYDDTGFTAEHHQKLAYKLTHLYFNYPGNIRVPAPCLYAHKLAFLTATYLHCEPHFALSQTLFYL